MAGIPATAWTIRWSRKENRLTSDPRARLKPSGQAIEFLSRGETGRSQNHPLTGDPDVVVLQRAKRIVAVLAADPVSPVVATARDSDGPSMMPANVP